MNCCHILNFYGFPFKRWEKTFRRFFNASAVMGPRKCHSEREKCAKMSWLTFDMRFKALWPKEKGGDRGRAMPRGWSLWAHRAWATTALGSTLAPPPLCFYLPIRRNSGHPPRVQIRHHNPIGRRIRPHLKNKAPWHPQLVGRCWPWLLRVAVYQQSYLASPLKS
jgi:hypothetical protein